VTIQDFGSIGELVAAIATIATLAYLAFQIRSNTIAMKAEARRGARIDSSAVTRLVAGSGKTAGILQKGLLDPKSLTPTESIRFQFLVSEIVFAPLETAEKEWRIGTPDREELDAVASHIAPLLSSPGAHWFWAQHRDEYPTELREYVDTLISAA
jgi:hypothetical protein